MNEDHSTEGKPQQKLWTRDFTIITLGSVVSMVGGTMTGFAISIMVLDYTGSTFLYALFNICFQIPMLVCPLLAGPVLDRMSRKKVIYRLDFLSSFVFLVFYLVMRSGWFSYPFLRQRKMRMQQDFRFILRRCSVDSRKVLQSAVGPRPRS